MNSDDASPRTIQERSRYSTNALQTLMEQNPLISKRSQLEFRQHTVVKPDILTLYFGFWGNRNWNSSIGSQVRRIMEKHYLATGRGPTQPEFDSLVEHGSRAEYHARIGLVFGYFVGGAWTYSFLRRLPRPPVHPNGPGILKRIFAMTTYPDLAGVAISSAVRFSAGSLFGSGLVIFFAFINHTKNVVTDSRLQGYHDEMIKQTPEDRRKRQLQLAKERGLASQRMQQNGGRSTQATGQPSADVSGSYGQDSDTSITPPNSYSEYTRSDNSQSSYSSLSTQPDAPVQSTGPLWARGRQAQPTNEQSSGLDFLDDDASPTAPEYRGTNIDGSSTGSAWDRIRRQNDVGRSPVPQQSAMSQPSQNPYSAQNDQAKQGELYGSDQWSEKDQAQAEFDRMIDAERNVGNEKSSRSRGWGS